MVKLLLSKGVNLDTQSYNGGTPLMRAIETSQKSIVKLLIEGGYVSMYTHFIITTFPLLYNYDTILMVCHRAKLSPINKHGETALEVARNWGDDYIYALLYAKAASLPPPPEAKG